MIQRVDGRGKDSCSRGRSGKAMALTEPLEAQVGPPLSIQELRRGGQPFHSPMRMESADALRSNVPVKGPSELSVACEVQVKFSLE